MSIDKGNLQILVFKGTPANQHRTRPVSVDEMWDETVKPFFDKYPGAQWFATEFTWDEGETWNIVNIFPLQILSTN